MGSDTATAKGNDILFCKGLFAWFEWVGVWIFARPLVDVWVEGNLAAREDRGMCFVFCLVVVWLCGLLIGLVLWVVGFGWEEEGLAGWCNVRPEGDILEIR